MVTVPQTKSQEEANSLKAAVDAFYEQLNASVSVFLDHSDVRLPCLQDYPDSRIKRVISEALAMSHSEQTLDVNCLV